MRILASNHNHKPLMIIRRSLINKPIRTISTTSPTNEHLLPTKTSTSTSQDKDPSRFKPRPTQATPSPSNYQRSLRYADNPFELNLRIKSILNNNFNRKDEDVSKKLETSLELIKSSSVRVANINVWTEFLKVLIDHKRFSMIHKVYLDCKRRNLSLDSRFFTTFFNGLSKAQRDSKYVKLDRLKEFWNQARLTIGSEDEDDHFGREGVERGRRKSLSKRNKNNNNSIELSNSYLNCLVNHREFDEALEFFKSLDDSSIDSITLNHLLKPISRHLKQQDYPSKSAIDLQPIRERFFKHRRSDGQQIQSLPSSSSSSSSKIMTRGEENEDLDEVLLKKLDLKAILSLSEVFLRSNDLADQRFGSKLLKYRFGLDLESDESNLRFKYWNSKSIENPLEKGLTVGLTKDRSKENGYDCERLMDETELTSLMRLLLKLKRYSLLRRIFNQIIKNPNLFLRSSSVLDSLHCGLAIVSFGKCKAVDEVFQLLIWMINSKEDRLSPTDDTLDKSIQAVWESSLSSHSESSSSISSLSKSIIILGCLTKNHKILNRTELNHDLIKSTTTEKIENDSNLPFNQERNDDGEKKVKVLKRGRRVRRDERTNKGIKPTNRSLSTLLQITNNSRYCKTEDLMRVLEVLKSFDRKLPEVTTTIQRRDQELDRGKDKDRSHERRVTIKNLDDEVESVKKFREIEIYWVDRFVWILSDVLDKLISRIQSYKAREDGSVVKLRDEGLVRVEDGDENLNDYDGGGGDRIGLNELIEWRSSLDEFISNDQRFRSLRIKIEDRVKDRILRRDLLHQKNKK